MVRRLAGSLLLLSLIAIAIGVGGPAGAVWLLALLALLSQLELSRLAAKFSGRMMGRQVAAWTLAILLGAWYLRPPHAGIWLSLLALLSVLTYGVIHLQPSQLLTHLLPSLLGLLYVPFALQFGVLLLRSGGDGTGGLWLLIWVVAVSKLGDVGALLVGCGYGRHSFASEYSPKKTWEGFFGGMLVAMAGGLGLAALAHYFTDFAVPLWLATPLSGLLAAVGSVADLLESALKRLARVKDSGKIIPGIGGCLDFCDTLILTLPTAHLVLQLLQA
jgi:phosphatidate cytidylyltransferase